MDEKEYYMWQYETGKISYAELQKKIEEIDND